jgi:hypothetical protein
VVPAVEECLEFINVFLKTIKSYFPKTLRMTGDYLAVDKTFHGAFLKSNKAIPLQALTGPEGSRSLRLPDFKTIGT